MAKVLEHPTETAPAYASERRQETLIPQGKHVPVSSNSQDESTTAGWSMAILTTGGSATGAAFLGGALLGGPVGAIGGTLIGIALGLFLNRSKSTKRHAGKIRLKSTHGD